MQQDLIYDVGMNNGDDTGYYLARGYRVVAVEADPTLVEECSKRFGDAIKAGRLTIVNCAVGSENTTAKFYICPRNRVWNSFDEAIAARNGADHYPIDVQVRRFRDVMAEHGVPMYLKVDIEGHDHYCLTDIDPADRPKYVSWEMERVEDVMTMRSKGYNAFQMRDQTTFLPLVLGRARGTIRRPFKARARDAAFKTLVGVPGAMSAARTVKRALKGSPPAPSAAAPVGEGGGPPLIVKQIQWPGGSWAFPFGSSGPFGEDLGGRWYSAEEAMYMFLDLQVNHDGKAPRWSGQWYDMHATTLPPGQAPAMNIRG